VWGGISLGPVTGSTDQPVTRAVAVAEMWAAMAVYDGGRTTERQLRSACQSLGVAYWRPEFERFNFFPPA